MLAKQMNPNIKKNLFLFFSLRFFTSLSLGLYFVFGSLLIYDKSHSITVTLLFNLVNYAGLILLDSICLPITQKIINVLGPKKCMTAGLLVLSFSYIFLFAISPLTSHFIFWLLAIALLNSIGSNFYWLFSNTTYYLLIGNSLRPASFSALLSTNSTLAGIAAVIIGLLFNYQKNIDGIFLSQGVILAAAIISLLLMNLPRPVYKIKFPDYLKKLSFFEHLAAMELNHELATTALPLVILLSFQSISKSFVINGIVAAGTIFIINIAGYLKDKNSNALIYVSSIISMVGWLLYAFIHTAASFIVIGILVGFGYQIVSTIFDGRLGRQFSNSGRGLEMQLSFNFSQILGRIIIILMLLFIYLLTHNISQMILISGAVFLLPKIIYDLRSIDSPKGAESLDKKPIIS